MNEISKPSAFIAETAREAAIQRRYREPLGVAETPWNKTIASQLNHRSVRAYLPDALPPGRLEILVAAAQSAPSSSNVQIAVPFVSTTHYSLLAALKHWQIDPKTGPVPRHQRGHHGHPRHSRDGIRPGGGGPLRRARLRAVEGQALMPGTNQSNPLSV